MNMDIDWLLSSVPWVRYRTRMDLLDQNHNHPDVIRDREEMINHPMIITLIQQLKNWPGNILKRHNDASHPIHILSFLAEIGINKNDPFITNSCKKIFDHQSDEGPFEILLNIPTHFGGSGKDEYMWMLCDAPLITYSLIKFSYFQSGEIKKSLAHLISLNDENGWHCRASEQLGQKFRGPGRKEDPCPYANLLMLKLISETEDLKECKEADKGLGSFDNLWKTRMERKPYLFGMGTDFKKLKAPFVWYDILHTMDVLSKYPHSIELPSTKEMLNILINKKDNLGRYIPESIYLSWKEWDFGQKKEPSPWITFLVYRILKRFQLL